MCDQDKLEGRAHLGRLNCARSVYAYDEFQVPGQREGQTTPSYEMAQTEARVQPVSVTETETAED